MNGCFQHGAKILAVPLRPCALVPLCPCALLPSSTTAVRRNQTLQHELELMCRIRT